jgi:hypothetical protein
VKALTPWGFGLVASSFALSLFSQQPADAGVSAIGFFCGMTSGAPSTNVVTDSGKQVPVIRWTSSVFSEAGWSQERRCQEVSSRFDGFLKQGRLAFITTGRINGLPVICTAASNAGPCDGFLYTLKPSQDSISTLRNLLEIRVKARGPLNETNSRLYVSLDELVSTALANAKQPASNSPPAIGQGTGLF